MASRILVYGACPPMRMILTSLLAASQHNVMTAETPQEARALAKVSTPDVILANTGGIDAYALMSILRSKSVTTVSETRVPVVLFDREITPARRVLALAAGARDLITWPVDERLLLARLRGVLREVNAMREVQRRKAAASKFGFAEEQSGFAPVQTVGIVAGSGGNSLFDQAAIRLSGVKVAHFTPGEAIGGIGGGGAIDAFVLNGTGDSRIVAGDALPELRVREHSRNAGILFIHDAEDVQTAVQALDSGASDIIAGDATPDEMIHRIGALLQRKTADDALRRSSETSLRLAATDPLTGLYNRRYAQAYLQGVLGKAAATVSPLTVMMVDIDHFKAINDAHGHAIGDSVLREVAARIRANLRSIDLVARYGGEEFLVVLPGTDMSQAGPAADRLRSIIGDQPVQLEGRPAIDVTVSIGVSVGSHVGLQGALQGGTMARDSSEDDVGLLVSAADRALYVAKETGRNRIEVAEDTG